jgi:hypothetical protein
MTKTQLKNIQNEINTLKIFMNVGDIILDPNDEEKSIKILVELRKKLIKIKKDCAF